jgi:hypothetical protein
MWMIHWNDRSSSNLYTPDADKLKLKALSSAYAKLGIQELTLAHGYFLLVNSQKQNDI